MEFFSANRNLIISFGITLLLLFNVASCEEESNLAIMFLGGEFPVPAGTRRVQRCLKPSFLAFHRDGIGKRIILDIENCTAPALHEQLISSYTIPDVPKIDRAVKPRPMYRLNGRGLIFLGLAGVAGVNYFTNSTWQHDDVWAWR